MRHWLLGMLFCPMWAHVTVACVMPGSTDYYNYHNADLVVVGEVAITESNDDRYTYLLLEMADAQYLQGDGPKVLTFTLGKDHFGDPSALSPGPYLVALLTHDYESPEGPLHGVIIEGVPGVIRGPCAPEPLMLNITEYPKLSSALIRALQADDPKNALACVAKEFELRYYGWLGGHPDKLPETCMGVNK